MEDVLDQYEMPLNSAEPEICVATMSQLRNRYSGVTVVKWNESPVESAGPGLCYPIKMGLARRVCWCGGLTRKVGLDARQGRYELVLAQLCANVLTCVEEGATGVDSCVWEVNVDASLPGATAIRAAGSYDKWFIIMGTYTHEKKNVALVLEPGARHSIFEIHPPIEDFAWEDRSGSDTNVVISTSEAAIKRLSQLPQNHPNASEHP